MSANLINTYRCREEYKTMRGIRWRMRRLKYVDGQAENIEIPFSSSTYAAGFLAFLVCSYLIDFFMQRRFSLPLLVPPMIIEEEEDQFSDDNNGDHRGGDVGPSTAGKVWF